MSHTPEIQPALTPEEWAAESGEIGHPADNSLGYDRHESGEFTISATHCGCHIDPTHNHAAAALCLHGQSFGFTRTDVYALRALAGDIEADRDNMPGGVDHPLYEAQLWVENLADRIEALLPPDEPGDKP